MMGSAAPEVARTGRPPRRRLRSWTAAACMALGPLVLFSGLAALADGTPPLGLSRWPVLLVAAGVVLILAGLVLLRGLTAPIMGLLLLVLIASFAYALLTAFSPEWREGLPMQHWPPLRDQIRQELENLV